MYGSFRASLPLELRDDRHFKIFYSAIARAPVAIIGLNPGGDPNRDRPFASASAWFEHREHDYVDCDYPLARKMRELLRESGLVADLEGIRAIPKLNVLFHRSRSIEQLVSEKVARELARPHVAAILREVQPQFLLVEGFRAATHLVRQQQLEIDCEETLVNGHILTMQLSGGPFEQRCLAVCLRHPTGYRWSRANWSEAMSAVGRLWSTVRGDRELTRRRA